MLENLTRTAKQNSPVLLSGIAIAGVIATAVLAAKATPKAMRRLEEAEEPELTVIDKFKVTWTCYIPAGLSAAATIACIAGANQIGARRNAALVGAYSLLDQTFREYKDQVVKEFGKDKEQKVYDEVMAEKMRKNPMPEDSQIIMTGAGEQNFWDSWGGRYFRSDIETIRQIANNVNKAMLDGDRVASLNDFYSYLNLEPTEAGNLLGWNLDNLIEPRFSAHMSDRQVACVALGFMKDPVVNYLQCY